MTLPAAGTAALMLEDVRFSWGGWQVSFDLTVGPGGITAIIGPSGAGKSTLLALVAGFEQPASGSIRLGTLDLLPLSPARRPVTTLFQEHNLFPHLTVSANVAIGLAPNLKLSADQKRTVSEALAAVGLAGMEKRLPSALSGGQRQRVALARCLVRRRPLLLLDEPFNGLDPALRLHMLDLVAEISREHGLTVLMVSHEPQDALRIAVNTCFVAEGKVLLHGPTAALLARRDVPALGAYLGHEQGQHMPGQ
ncbi:thiamine ABC transporter ATP-binding protein [Radicibacter daui]|uniref:thiamine ABC transporter ATP-binding protein n=1 Tax=Radicibacter daui TaxID=3064829 RepID=UPI0040469197